jgi:hypothetical protein
MNVVGIIMARLGLDTRDFKTGIAEAKNMSGQFSASLLGLPNLGMVLGGVGIGVAGALTRDILESAKHVQYLSERFGVSTTVIQQWGHAAEQGGSDMEAMTMGFNRLEVSQAKALQGNEEMLAHFHSLGISLTDLQKLTPDELMKRLGASSMNAADMVGILGRNGTQLIPILKGVADGTLKFGAAISEIDVKKLAEADDFLIRLGQHGKVEAAGFLSNLIGGIQDAGGELSVLGKKFGSFFTAKNKEEAVKSAHDLMLALKAEFTSDMDYFEREGRSATKPGEAGGIMGGAAKKGFGDEDQQNKLDEKVQKASAVVEALKLELAGEEQLAAALKTNADFEEKIADAKSKGLVALAEELELERELTLQKQQQAIDTKRLESIQLSLKELADTGAEYSNQGTLGPGHYAREAMAELESAKALMQKGGFGDIQEALQHKARAEEIKLDIPELREGEKDRNSIDASKTIGEMATDLKTIAQNSGDQIVVVNQ